jgi:hypothetical protein
MAGSPRFVSRFYPIMPRADREMSRTRHSCPNRNESAIDAIFLTEKGPIQAITVPLRKHGGVPRPALYPDAVDLEMDIRRDWFQHLIPAMVVDVVEGLSDSFLDNVTV